MLVDVMRPRTAYIEIWDEDHEPLQIFALEQGRTYKQQASYLLHLKIREEVERRQRESEPAEQVA